MKKYLPLLFCLAACVRSYAQHYNTTYGAPIIVLIETNPWLMVIGSDVPTFALYENGQIIYKKVVNGKLKYFELKQTREKTQAVVSSLGITDSLMLQPENISASTATDQPTNELVLNFDSIKVINVYGALRGPAATARGKTPKVFLKVYDNIVKFESKTAQEWMPDTVEVMATRYSNSPEKPAAWVKAWGGINNTSTVKRGDDLYSIYIPKKYFPDFIKLIGSLNEQQAVEIDGEKYSLTYRFIFPNVK